MKRTLTIIAVGLTFGFLIGFFGMSKAHAVQIEEPNRQVDRLAVTYAEPMPARGHEARHYFELNDGSAWGYRGYGPCARANAVPNHICRTVFWYAR